MRPEGLFGRWSREVLVPEVRVKLGTWLWIIGWEVNSLTVRLRPLSGPIVQHCEPERDWLSLSLWRRNSSEYLYTWKRAVDRERGGNARRGSQPAGKAWGPIAHDKPRRVVARGRGSEDKGRKGAGGGEAHVAVFTIGLSPTYLVVIVFKWSQSKTLHAD